MLCDVANVVSRDAQRKEEVVIELEEEEENEVEDVQNGGEVPIIRFRY